MFIEVKIYVFRQFRGYRLQKANKITPRIVGSAKCNLPKDSMWWNQMIWCVLLSTAVAFAQPTRPTWS